MNEQALTYDFFASYSRKDNEKGWITDFIEALKKEHEEMKFERPLKPFFDKDSIHHGDDWQIALHEGITHSSLFIAFLSPNYFASEWCRKEWIAWIEHEISIHILEGGIRPLFIVPVPGFEDRMTEAEVARGIADLCQLDPLQKGYIESSITVIRNARKRNNIKDFVRPFADEGRTALQEHALREILKRLAQDVQDHAERVKAADRSVSTVPPYNAKFTGRIDELLQLREWLAKDNRTGVIYGIHGLGGIGKTELAFTYAQAFAGAYPGGRFYIRCENAQTLSQALLSQLDFMAFFNHQIPEQDRMRPEEHYAALLAAMRRRLDELGAMLLVLDNVADHKLLETSQTDSLTALGPKLHLLATTRLLPSGQQSSQWLSLDRLPDVDALALFEKHRAFDDEEEEIAARRLVTSLGGFTLAIELTAAWLAVHERKYADIADLVGLSELTLFGEDKDVALRRHNDEKRLEAILGPVLGGLSQEARRTMEYAAFLPPDVVALPWLRDLVVGDFPEAGEKTPFKDPWEDVLRSLRGASLISQKGSEDSRLCRVHRLVQEILKQQMTSEQKALVANRVEDLVEARISAFHHVENWTSARWELEPLAAIGWLWDDSSHDRAAWMLNNVAFHLHTVAEWSLAEPLMRRALRIDEDSYGVSHPNVARDLNNLATLLQATNRLGEAEALIRRSLKIVDESSGESHPEVAAGLHNLACLLQDTNRLAEAEPLMRRALKMNEESFGKYHPTVAIVLNSLALLLQDTSRLAEAEHLMRCALQIDEASYGESHPDVARDLNNLATLLQSTNRPGEAELLMRRALKINEERYGEAHPNVAIGLNNLAALLQYTSRPAEAEPLMRRALTIDEESYGESHPAVARDLNNLAQLLQVTNRLAEAEPLMRRALTIDEASYGECHPDVATKLNNLAVLLQATNRFAEAEPLIRRALTIDEESYGESHPAVARDLSNLANLLYATNRLAEAEPLMQRALKIDEESYGESHPDVATKLNNLARLLQATNRLAEAEPLMRRHLVIFADFGRAVGHPHPHFSDAVQIYAGLLNEMGFRQEQVIAALLLIAPEYFDDAPNRETYLRHAETVAQQAAMSGDYTVARILYKILAEQAGRPQ